MPDRLATSYGCFHKSEKKTLWFNCWVDEITIIWLVVTGTMEVYDFPETVGNVIIPTDEVIFFRGVETTNQDLFVVNS